MRRSVVAVTALVALAALVGALATGAVAQDLTLDEPIDNCTVVDEPGQYELGGDVQTNDSGACLDVRSDDVVIEGNGHAIEGPGADGGTNASAGVLVNGTAEASYTNVTVRDVEVSGFDDGVRSGTDGADGVALEGVTVTGTDRGVAVHGGNATLTDVTVEESGVGVYADGADTVEASGVTVQSNGAGLQASGTDVVVDNSSIGYNDGHGVELDAGATLSSSDSRMNGNGGHGVVASGGDVSVELWDDEVGRNADVGLLLEGGAEADLAWTSVPRNGEDGVRVDDGTLNMEDTALKNNAGYELDARGGLAHADDLEVNQSAVVAFENEPIALGTVDRAELPDAGNATVVSDGLTVEGSLDGSIEAELTVETDDDTVEVWRDDGDQWTTVAENVSVSNDSIQHTVIESGTYAAVEAAAEESEESEESDETDESDESEESDEDSDAEESDESDDSSSSSGSSSSSYSGGGSSYDSSSGSSSEGGILATATPTPTPTETATETPTETATEEPEPEETESADETDEGDESDDDVAAAQEVDEDEDADEDDGGSLADGPGFGGLAALLALLASAGLLYRRH